MLKSFLKSHNVPTSARPESSKESHDFRAMQDRMGRLTTQDSLSRQISAAPPLHSMNDGNFFKACSMPANLAATSPPVNFRSLSPIAQRDDRSQLWSPTSPQSDSSLKPNPLDLPYPTSPESVWSPERGLSPTRLRSPDHSSRRENGGVFKKQRPKRFTHAVPSNFCHICCRSSKRVRKVICKNIEIGICRKVICEKCFTAFGWEWEAATAPDSNWLCTHCSGQCPARSQCGIYNRTNSKRKTQKQKLNSSEFEQQNETHDDGGTIGHFESEPLQDRNFFSHHNHPGSFR